MYKRMLTAAGLCLCAPLAASAGSSAELDEIRDQMESLKRAYETQLKALEQRLDSAEAQLREAQTPPQGDTAAVAAVAPVGDQQSPNAFNPALSVILQGSLNSYSQNPDSYVLPGFQLGGEAGLPAEGLTLDETEITASASVDQLFYGQSTIALHEDEDGTEVEVEEAYVDPLALPAGFGGRFGRFYSQIGYLNPVHPHAWDFRDQPLVYRAFLGSQYRDDGLRVNWTAPTDLYLVFGAETLAGNSFPAGESDNVLGDVQTLVMKVGGDIGVSSAWQGGLSWLRANVNDRSDGGHHHDGETGGTLFSGDSDLYIADFVYKWAPDGNPQRHNLILQSEFFYRHESGDVNVTEGANNALMDYDGDQWGWYAQAVYQFLPRWRVGARYDRLSSDNDLSVLDLGGFADPEEVIEDSGLDARGYDPQRWSLMVDWDPSEFSRLRAQYNRDESRRHAPDNQWTLQYIMSLGAHGAHLF
jgi:hypothetical protein